MLFFSLEKSTLVGVSGAGGGRQLCIRGCKNLALISTLGDTEISFEGLFCSLG